MVSAEVILFWYRGKPLKKILICCWRAVLFKQYRLSAYIGFSNLKKYVSWEWKIWYIYIRQRGIGIQEQAKEKYESTVGRPSKENRSPNGEQLNKIHTDKELAKLAGVGTGTVARYDRVMN